MIKVRALKDGHYAGYYRYGPIESDQGNRPGEVFEVDETPYELKDEQGRPIYELDTDGKRIPVLVDGKQKKDSKGQPMFRVRTASFFTTEWMERVSDSEPVTYDHEPFQLPKPYRSKKGAAVASAPAVALPSVPAESPI